MTYTPQDPQPFDSEACTRVIGASAERNEYGVEAWHIYGTGWVIYDATRNRGGDPFVWGYEHRDDGREYGEVENLGIVLREILAANVEGMGDYPDNPVRRVFSNMCIRAAIRRLGLEATR